MYKRVRIHRGVPGSGKSHMARSVQEGFLKQGGTAYVCSADNFFVTDDGEYKFDIRKIGEAHAWCMSEFLKALSMEMEYIVVDNTNTRVWEFENYAKAAEMMGYEVVLVEFDVETREQLRECAARCSHGLSVEDIAKMWVRFEDTDRWPTHRIPFSGLKDKP